MHINNIYLGDNLELLKRLKNNSIGSSVSDFPYNLGFMGKRWDTIENYQQWCYDRARELYRVLKPGAWCLVFGGTRTHHRLVSAFEDAGFIIRDEISWIYGSGLPKSYNVSKRFDKKAGAKRQVVGKYTLPNGKKWNLKQDEDDSVEHSGGLFTSSGTRKLDITAPATELAIQWDGWGTALKPAHEPIMVAQKPLDGTYCENLEKWGVGGLNIDSSRIQFSENDDSRVYKDYSHRAKAGLEIGKNKKNHEGEVQQLHNKKGRWPANLILDDDAGKILDGQTGTLKSGKSDGFVGDYKASIYGKYANNIINPETVYGDSGGASRFFYCPKATRKDRTEGGKVENVHPTVKPTDLIKYLVRLVTPPNEVSLDICSGSGTHAKACVELTRDGYPVDFVGFESDREIFDASLKRIEEVLRKTGY